MTIIRTRDISRKSATSSADFIVERAAFLFRLMREHVPSYLLGTLFLAATLWMSFAIPRHVADAIDLLSGLGASEDERLPHLVGWIFFFAIGIVVTRTASRLLFFVPGRRVEFDLKNRLLVHLTKLQRGFYAENPSGSIISRINNDVVGVRMLLGTGLMTLLSTVGTLSLAPYYMYAISPTLTLYCAMLLTVGFVALQIALRRMRRYQTRHMRELQHLSEFTVESLNGVDLIKSYRMYGWAESRFAGIGAEVCDAAVRASNIRAYFMPLLLHMTNGLKILVVLVGGAMVIQEGMSIGDFMAFMLYLSMLVSPLMGMTFMLFLLTRGVASLGSLLEIFQARSGLPVLDAGGTLPNRLEHGIRVHILAYSYPDDPEKPVLTDVSLSVAPGEVIGVFGPVGSGKSTLINLINGYLTPPRGSIFLDTVDAVDIHLANIRQHIVTVAQEPFLFSDTIGENIAFAVDYPDRDELNTVVAQTALVEDLSRMPAGIDTIVGEKGITLSGGQKQRVSLARAAMVPCDLLLLDDVLSAVDHETERHLIGSIYGFAHASSTLIVSHRLSALKRANRVIVLDAGRIVDEGPHAELVSRAGLYQDAWRLQSSQDVDH